eukprot:15447028-Alexandrium_andersonii.AAC.1
MIGAVLIGREVLIGHKKTRGSVGPSNGQAHRACQVKTTKVPLLMIGAVLIGRQVLIGLHALSTVESIDYLSGRDILASKEKACVGAPGEVRNPISAMGPRGLQSSGEALHA